MAFICPWIFDNHIEDICLFFSVKDRNLFHREETIGNIFTSGCFCLFHAFNPFWEKLCQNTVQFFSIIPSGVPLPYRNALQYYVKREKCKVNDILFSSGCEARTINQGNKNMKICIFTGGTSVRLKNIFTDISQYPTGKHEINLCIGSYLPLDF